MKKIIIILSLFIINKNIFAQKTNVDSVIHAISVSKNDSIKIDPIVSLFTPEANNNSDYVIGIGLKLLKQAEVDKNSIEESAA